MIIDVHAHILYDIEKDKRDTLKAMELYGIDKVYVSAVREMFPDRDEVHLLNNEVAKFIREQPGKVGGYVYINPTHPDAMDVLRRGVEEQGMDGVKLWMSTLCDDVSVYPIAEQAAEYNIPILIHAFYKATGQYEGETLGQNVAELAKRYPQLKLIMAHLGGNCYHGIPSIARLENVWVDFSGSIVRAEALRYTIRRVGADRVLFGTDMPGIALGCIGQVMELPDKDVREKLFYRNALQVFDRNNKLEVNANDKV